MRAQQDREEQTVLIGTALGVFAVVMAAQLLGLWLIHAVFDVASGDAILECAVVIAGTVSIANLVRSQRN